MLQYKDKWTLRRFEQVPRIQHHKDRQRTDINENDSVDDRSDGSWQCVLRPLGFGRSESDHFNSAEGEDDGGECGENAGNAVGQKASICPEIDYASVMAHVSNPKQPDRNPA